MKKLFLTVALLVGCVSPAFGQSDSLKDSEIVEIFLKNLPGFKFETSEDPINTQGLSPLGLVSKFLSTDSIDGDDVAVGLTGQCNEKTEEGTLSCFTSMTVHFTFSNETGAPAVCKEFPKDDCIGESRQIHFVLKKEHSQWVPKTDIVRIVPVG